MAMKLFLDTVQGAELDSGIGVGRLSRMALVTGYPIPAGHISSATALVEALAILGLPQKGDSFPFPGYEDYFLKRHIVRAFTAQNYGIEMIYEFRGLLTVSDTSSLSFVPSQLHPKDFKPYYVKWNGGGGNLKKVLTLQVPLPMRHLVISQTIDFMASSIVLEAFGGVNKFSWQGLDPGYWLFSGLEGDTQDDGITYTYTVTFSTKMKEDWSQFGFLEDDAGNAVPVDEDKVSTLRSKPYEYSIDDSVDGLLKVGNHEMFDFYSIFNV